MTTNDERPDVLFKEIVELLRTPRLSVDSSFRALTQERPYRDLVRLGPSVLKFCMARIKEGALFLVPAVLEIWQVLPEAFGLKPYASDNEVAACLLEEWETLNCIQWTADGLTPSAPLSVQHVSEPTSDARTHVSPFRFGSPVRPIRTMAEL
jgi:hypothetical protein